MIDIKDGGPAFPQLDFGPVKSGESYLARADGTPVDPDNKPLPMKVFYYGGMTLRDYFAAKAMQGILACESDTEMSAEDCATFAYTQADAMLSARSK